jgi:hypothetical protein
MTHSVEAPPV